MTAESIIETAEELKPIAAAMNALNGKNLSAHD